MILKYRPEKTAGRPLDNDLLITLLMWKTVGPLQPHLRLNQIITTFTEAPEIVYSYEKSRHLTVLSGRIDHQGQADMEIGALKGKKGWKGKGMKRGEGMCLCKGKGFKGNGMFSYNGKGKGKKGYGKGKGMNGRKGKGKGQG